VKERNEERYRNTLNNGKNYDAKNMMHTFRLLNMAEEIAKECRLHVRRKDRDFLLKIRSGVFSYEDLVQQADEKIDRMDEWYRASDLPDSPDLLQAEELLVRMRKLVYATNAE
jgi:hypothetical protein